MAQIQQIRSITCPHCGHVLFEDVSLEREDDVQDILSSTLATHPLEYESPTFELLVTQSGRHIILPTAAAVYLGRRDERRSIYPDVDLTQDEGALYGVSRQHACIYQGEDGAFVEDINSTNGTFVNGQRLAPMQMHPLHDDDLLTLGQLEMRVALSGAE
jgi:hypothetical protein